MVNSCATESVIKLLVVVGTKRNDGEEFKGDFEKKMILMVYRFGLSRTSGKLTTASGFPCSVKYLTIFYKLILRTETLIASGETAFNCVR